MKTLDFNTINRPALQLVMQDDNHTTIKVGLPKEALIEELQEITPALQEANKSGNGDAMAMCYNLAARLISCNHNGITVTAEELKTKYNIDLECLILFYSAYLDFVNEVSNAKN